MTDREQEDRIVDAIFVSEQFKNYCTREGDVAVFASGYGSGPITINVRDIVRSAMLLTVSDDRAIPVTKKRKRVVSGRVSGSKCL